MRKIIVFELILALCCINLSAQEAVLTSGGDATGSGGSMSYSLGQVLYTVDTGNEGFIIHGVQQPREISVISSVRSIIRGKYEISLFPVPADDFVNLKIDNLDYSKINYQLIDIRGKTLFTGKMNSNLAQIPTKNLAKGLYFIRIKIGENQSETYRIIKN